MRFNNNTNRNSESKSEDIGWTIAQAPRMMRMIAMKTRHQIRDKKPKPNKLNISRNQPKNLVKSLKWSLSMIKISEAWPSKPKFKNSKESKLAPPNKK